MNQKLIGFFKSDRFPYAVAYNILSIDKNGDFEVPQGFYLKSSSLLKLLPYEQGNILKEKLNLIEEEYKKSTKKVEELFQINFNKDNK
jgi:hypothetical protein